MLAKKYSFKETEEKWINYWQDNKVYAFKRDDNKTVYSIDTPPPTVSRKHTYRAYFLIFTNRNDSKIQKVKRI